MTMLVDGWIPAGVDCPFDDICENRVVCSHVGEHHKEDFSCPLARLLDALDLNKEQE